MKLPIRDLANWARITVPEAADALRVFQEPDPYSSSKEDGGRRLRPIAGEEDWFELITWEKHAAEREAFFSRLRQQRFRDKNRAAAEKAIARQGECACCGDAFEEPFSLYVVLDHDHSTGETRGLICKPCNKVVGLVESGAGSDSPKTVYAETYLRAFSALRKTAALRKVTKEPEPEPEPKESKPLFADAHVNKVSPKKRTKRATLPLTELPEDWLPLPELRAKLIAKYPQHPFEETFQSFRRNHIGKGTKWKRWDLALENWFAERFVSKGNRSQPPPPPRSVPDEISPQVAKLIGGRK